MHVKLATLGLPHVKLVHVALPYYRVGHHDHDKEEYRDHDGFLVRSHESLPVMADVHERMEDPPHTWAAYRDKPGGRMTIVEMEYQELMTAKAEGSKAGMIKELTDLAAACICAIEKMKSM